MRINATTAPPEPGNLLIRMHNRVGAAIEVTGTHSRCLWKCDGCGELSAFPDVDYVDSTRRKANTHAAQCWAAFHRLSS